MKTSWISVFAAFPLLLCQTAWPHEDESPPAGMPERLGQVSFPVTCSAAAQEEFNRSVALLHSFYYIAAVKAFTHVTETDPACAMGYWGVAMSWWYPLWYPPTTASLAQGKAALDKARSAGAKTDRERAYIEAIAAFYQDYDKQSHAARARAYEAAMQRLHEQFGEDREATAFYALAMQATIDPNDKTYAKQLQSAALLEPLFAQQPEHPGLAHYLIHAYDYPGLAARALDAARHYGEIAPSVPHALHMPAHTFMYLGYWQDAIRSDTAAAATARKQGDLNSQLHSMDYLVYAYLQSGQEQSAKSILDDLGTVNLDSKERPLAIDYALAAAPARYAIELRRWADAATLAPSPSRFPATVALTHYARALGAAHTGNLALAREDVSELAALRDVLVNAKNDYWAKQVEMQRLTASAWLAWAEGDTTNALARMRAAADLEDSTYKHAVTPGQIIPARELLADMLVELGRPAEALAEYEATLRVTPSRFNAVYGAAHSAELAGDSARSKAYYAQLLEICGQSVSARPELQHAHMVLGQN